MQAFQESRQLYMGLTRDSADSITRDIFYELDEMYKIGLRLNKAKLTWTHPNGSTCRIFGMDSSEKEMRKVLGQRIRKVSIDEAGSITVDMKKLVYQMLNPALADLRPYSWLTLLGTCENIPNTFFEKVTTGQDIDVKWKVRKWTAYDNPYMKKQWTEEIEEMTANNPLITQASWFKTHYLNEWCADDELLIIPVKSAKFVDYKKMTDDTYILGIDLGYNDANSFTVLRWNHRLRRATIVKSYKKSELIFSQVAEEIKKLEKDYNFSKYVIDGANKQGVEEIKQRFGIPLESASKTDKAIMLKLLKDDIVTQNLEISEADCQELYDEWLALMWKNTDKQEEDPRCQNHCSDSALYAWRYCRHFLWVNEPPPASKDSNEYMDELEREEAERLEEEQRSDEALFL